MKVFFTTSSDNTDHYKKTLNALDGLVGKRNVFSPETRANVKMGESKDKATEAVAIKEKQLKESDICIADITHGKAGVGYFISTALYLRKPTLVIQRESDSLQEIHDSITAGRNKLLTYEVYNDKTLEKIITNFIQKGKKAVDTKFILIIPPEIDRYLEWASDYKRMHKAQVVREAIENYMDKDQDWQEFLEEE